MITETAVEPDERHSWNHTQESLSNKVVNARSTPNATGWHPMG